MKTNAFKWSLNQIARMKRAMSSLPAIVQNSGGILACSQKTIGIMQREGWAGVKLRLWQASQPSAFVLMENGNVVHRFDYEAWVQQYDSINDDIRNGMKARIDAMLRRPKISIVMPVYDPPLDYLDEAIWSVRKQIYGDWEFCIADDASKNEAVRTLLKKHAAEDGRIKIVFRTENGHISKASNSALQITSGEYIALFDNDDVLPEHALFYVVETILANPDAVIIYSDEDKLDRSGRRIDPYFKCDWNPELFLGHNLISHFGVYRTDHIRAIEGFRVGYEGSQDYDLAARIIERIEPSQIVHIPRILYHWRMLPGSAAMGTSEKPYALLASEKALNEHLARQKIDANVSSLPIGMHHVRYRLPNDLPLISIIVPTRDSVDLVRTCITSLFQRTDYKNFEVLLVDNGSTDPSALEYFRELQRDHSNFRVVTDNRPFNFSAINNGAVKEAKGELLVLLNNDTEVISSDWLSELASIALQPNVGVVGAKLYYSNERLQHGGVILGLGASKVAGHMHHNISRSNCGYYGRAVLTQQISAVTAACMMVRKDIYQAVGGLNEDLQVAFNDIDFCLRVGKAGYRNIWTPHAELYHHESTTRGADTTAEKQARFISEVDYMQRHWGDILMCDPAYNVNLTLDHSDFSLAWPPRCTPMPSSNTAALDISIPEH